MSRRLTALKPQLNRIRAWAHEGSTDAWIAHQLDTTAEAVRAFRQEHGIERGGPAPLAPITPDSVVEAMLAEEEAAAAAAELGPEASAPEPEAPAGRGARACAPSQDAPARRQAGRGGTRGRGGEVAESAPAEEAPARSSSSRRRGTRGGAGRGAAAAAATAEVVDEQPAAEAEERRGRGR